MAKKSFPLSKVYTLLEPGPVVLVTTVDKTRPNIMAMSWHTMLEFEPPLAGCVISNRNHSFDLLQATGECVINIPTVDIAEKVVGCGNTSGTDTDKFRQFGLTPKPASQVGAPLIEECYANLECRVADRSMVGSYCFFCPGSPQGLDRSGGKRTADHTPSRPRQVHGCRGRDRAQIKNEVTLLTRTIPVAILYKTNPAINTHESDHLPRAARACMKNPAQPQCNHSQGGKPC